MNAARYIRLTLKSGVIFENKIKFRFGLFEISEIFSFAGYMYFDKQTSRWGLDVKKYYHPYSECQNYNTTFLPYFITSH